MKTLNTGSPKAAGFRMPGEYEPHRGTVLIWPVRPGSWPYEGKEAKQKFAEIAGILSAHEQVWMLADGQHAREAEEMLTKACRSAEAASKIPSEVGADLQNPAGKANAGSCGCQVLVIPTDDAWARDVGPTCITDDRGTVLGIDWQFNAWGGTWDGLYRDWRQDNEAASRICRELGIGIVNARDFVLEGGSIAADGEGTVVTTECCLLSPGRNPQLGKKEIEARLKNMLGAEKVIWLPNGIYNDETNGHVDNIFAFTRPGEGVLAWTDNQEDPQYKLSLEDLQVLEQETDARGRKIRIRKMSIPDRPVCIRQEDLQGYRFEPGEDERTEGERLAASYVNFYIANDCVLVPQFGDPADRRALTLLEELFPERTICPVQARCILTGGGNIHCITQQIPLGKGAEREV